MRLVRDESERLRRMEVEERREAMASAEAGVRAAAASASASGREGGWEDIPEWVLAEGRAEEERVKRMNGGGGAGSGDASRSTEEETTTKKEVPKPAPSLPPAAPMAERSGLCVICCDR